MTERQCKSLAVRVFPPVLKAEESKAPDARTFNIPPKYHRFRYNNAT